MSIQFSEVAESYGNDVLQENTTVNLNSSMTATEIQALINAQPKNLGGYNLTFQFADGTYTLDSQLTFGNFFNGRLYILGNNSEGSLSTSKSVHLDFSSSDVNGVYVTLCETVTYVQYFKITVNSSNNKNPVTFESNSNFSRCQGNYLLGSTDDGGFGVYGYCTNLVYVYKTYVSNLNMGLRVFGGILYSTTNDDTGTPPKYGLGSYSGATIGKSGTQPSGGTADEYTSGGQIL